MDTFNPAIPTYEGGRIIKMEVDYSSACDEKIPLCKEMAKNESKFNDALDILLSLEKQARVGSDMMSSARILVAIVQIIFEANKWDLLNEYVAVLAKKRSQSKQAIVKMVQECCTYVDRTPDKETKIKLIDALRVVSEGKIYVENERARLTKILSDIKEADGDILGAATIMEALQIETYGTMDKREKVEFILEQMRLCLAKHDLVRTQIISKKISTKFFNDPEQQDLKLKYYELMILLDKEQSYIKTARYYLAIADSESITNDVEKRKPFMINAVLYCILSPYDNEQVDLMNNLYKNKFLEDIPLYKELLKLFLCKELINFDALNQIYGKELATLSVFDKTSEHGKKSWDELKNRLIEHVSDLILRFNLI
jgi:26S proteasome regulatory subunit N5